MEIRNPIYNEFGTIDCEINHPSFGWIPYTASSDDVEQLGRDIYAQALLLNPNPYVAPSPPPPPSLEELSEEARITRNNLLTKSDWTQLPDAPVDKDVWATYRQQLRDITLQSGFPENIIWPDPPVT